MQGEWTRSLMRATSWWRATQFHGLVGYLDAVLKTLNCIQKEHVSLQYAYLLKLPDQEAIIQSLEMVLNHEHFKNIEWHQAFPVTRMLWNKDSTAEGRAKNHKSVESEQQATKPQLGQRGNKRWGQHTNKNNRECQYIISNFDLKSIIFKMATMRWLFFLNYSLFHYTCPNFSFYPSFLQPNLPLHSPSPHRRPFPRDTQTCSLTNPFPSSPSFPYYLSSWSCQTVPCIHDSVSVLFVIFCVHYFPPSSQVISKLWVTENVVVREKFHHYR